MVMSSTPPDTGQSTRGARTGREDRGRLGDKWWTLVAVCLGTFMLLLDITIVTVALPDIQRALHSSFADLQWVVDAYALTLAAFLLTGGSLADMYGRRVLYLIGLAVFTGASALCGFATSTLMLQLSRGLQGVGAAIIFAVSLALLANAFHGKDRGVAFGVWGAVTGLAVALGPLIGGALTSGLSWRWIFFVNVPIGIAALVLTTMRVAESRAPRATGPDWAGFVIFTAALASLVYGLIESNQRSFTDGLVLGCLVAAAVLLALFVVVERRSAHPMFDLKLLRLPTFSGGAVAAFGLSASIFSMLLYLVLYFQDILGYSPLGAGLRLMVISGGILATSTVAGRLTSRVPIRLLIGPGLLIVGIGLLLMRGLDAGSAWTHLIPGMILGGVGAGLVNPPLASTAVGVVPPQQAGMASGINSTFRQVGTATGIALLGTLFSSEVKHEVLTRTAGPRPVRPGTGDRRGGPVRADRQRDRAAARARQAGRGNDHPGRLHHRPGPHPAGRGDHRVRRGRHIAGRYPQPGLRARRTRRSGRSPDMRRPGQGDRPAWLTGGGRRRGGESRRRPAFSPGAWVAGRGGVLVAVAVVRGRAG
jgi:EmrB/QacA subfamily drug resistance transporter